MTVKRIWIATIAAFALAACASPATPSPNSVTSVVSTTSFGMCAGFCVTRLTISRGEAVLIREARRGRGAGNYPATPTQQRFSVELTLSEWQEIQRLAAAADLAALPDVVGCPDCADGGAESLTIDGSGGPESVSFEYGATLPPAQALIDRVRALRAQLTPEDPS
jgi:hypothetical protein